MTAWSWKWEQWLLAHDPERSIWGNKKVLKFGFQRQLHNSTSLHPHWFLSNPQFTQPVRTVLSGLRVDAAKDQDSGQCQNECMHCAPSPPQRPRHSLPTACCRSPLGQHTGSADSYATFHHI